MNRSLEKKVLENFDFLRAFGLEPDTTNLRWVDFQNEAVVVRVGFDVGRSYEVDVWVGRRGAGELYSLQEILHMETGCSPRAFLASSDHAVDLGLRSMAQQLRERCPRLLEETAGEFERLAKHRRSMAGQDAQQRALKRALVKAQEEWRAQNFQAVVEALTPFEERLSESERLRLGLARKRVKR
ncbi:MAG: hypothetical protein AAGC60_30130 [Acidobacteriota bacterium]